MLTAVYKSGLDNSYRYNVDDLQDIVLGVPAYIQITKVPKNGDIVIMKFGQKVALNEGDIIHKDMLKNFIYDQGTGDICSGFNPSKCTDEFKYVPYGEWVGTGNY